MKLETVKGLFPPRGRRIEDIEQDGFMFALYSPNSGESEWVADKELNMNVADTVADQTELELIILSWG